MNLKGIIKPININKLPVQKLIIVCLVVVCVVSIRSCSLKDLEITNSGVKIEMYKAQASVFEEKYNKSGDKVAIQEEMIMERDKALEMALLEKSTLKSLNEQIRVASDTKIKNIIAKYESSGNGVVNANVITYDSTGAECVLVGTKFSSNDDWYELSGKIDTSGVIIDSISVKDTTTVNVGFEKNSGLLGFMKPRKPVVEVIHSNRNVTTKGIQNIRFDDRSDRRKTKVLLFGGGVVVGIAVVVSALHLFY